MAVSKSVSPVRFDSYRISDIQSKLNIMGVRPLDVMVTGVTGAGKSTTLNKFFQRTVAKVGEGAEPETMEINSYELNDSFRIWDTPGLGDGVLTDQKHKKKMTDMLYKKYTYKDMKYGVIDMCLVIVEGSKRDMGTTYTLLNEVIVPNISSDRIIVAINQADVAMGGRHWIYETKTPDSTLMTYLEQQAYSVQKRIREATGVKIIKPVCYSARYGWNVQSLFDRIIDNIPSKRRTLAT